ncbi:hypothetical protein V1512DRAFT_270363 [Lipomyces arxii]|uniref:uncharacterized protein n=1 Tax=Lipomyces arxii TaxID=56418 RepID=UPI0034CDB6CD
MYSDPYDDLAREVDQQLMPLRQQAKSYIFSVTSPSPAAGPSPATPTLENLTSTIDELDLTLQDLRESVDAVESSPQQYGLTEDQIEERRRFVDARSSEVSLLRHQISEASRAKQPRPQFTTINFDDDDRQSSPYDMGMEREHQALLMRDQDEQLDGVLNTVHNLREQAVVMGNELQEHVDILEELDNDVDRSQSKLEVGMKRMKYILKKNEDKASNWCIGLLAVVLFFLLLVVLFA